MCLLKSKGTKTNYSEHFSFLVALAMSHALHMWLVAAPLDGPVYNMSIITESSGQC